LQFSVSGIRGRQRRTVAYPMPALGRGRYTVGPTEVSATDPFGLVVADSRSSDTAELVIRPQRQQLAPLNLPMAWRDGGSTTSHSVGSGGSDDASVREYRYGDDLRKVHWRSSARTGGLMVRQEERPWHGNSLVLLDTRVTAYPTPSTSDQHRANDNRVGHPANTAFEWAVSAAASISCHLAECGRRVALVGGSGQAAHNDVSPMLDLLADTRPANRADLEPLADALGGLGRDSSVFAILAGHDRAVLSDLAARGRAPGSAVALLLQPWTFITGSPTIVPAAGAQHGSVPTASSSSSQLGPSVNAGEAEWLLIAEALRSNGWRVVAVAAGDELTTLWPELLASARVSR
jgi:uncharacterized protein (DUF58 family)